MQYVRRWCLQRRKISEVHASASNTATTTTTSTTSTSTTSNTATTTTSVGPTPTTTPFTATAITPQGEELPVTQQVTMVDVLATGATTAQSTPVTTTVAAGIMSTALTAPAEHHLAVPNVI